MTFDVIVRLPETTIYLNRFRVYADDSYYGKNNINQSADSTFLLVRLNQSMYMYVQSKLLKELRGLHRIHRHK